MDLLIILLLKYYCFVLYNLSILIRLDFDQIN
jgi:hypothetical protein